MNPHTTRSVELVLELERSPAEREAGVARGDVRPEQSDQRGE